MQAAKTPEMEPLPKLRPDLDIVAGAEAGEWLIVDPLRHAHYLISKPVLDLLAVWHAGTVEGVKALVANRHGRDVADAEIAEVGRFLNENELVAAGGPGEWRKSAARAHAREKHWLVHLTHSYLFFRIPLVRPQPFIDASWPLVRLLFSRGFAIALCFFAVVSGWLVLRQWETFAASFSAFLTFEGFLAYGAGLVFVKVIHEFGHAFMAKRFNVGVPTLGVAFIVLLPILYTDTTAAWRVSRARRLAIDAGGIIAELALAVIATTFWVFLPEGDARSVAFVVATVSWVMSLAVNLNPLMRFDGYFLLADGLGIENLQARGFAVARWRLREWLFGFGDGAPEEFSPRMRWFLVIHAFATWIYRFFLFLGIALVVYHFAFKLIGIALFLIEIVWFILLPIWREMVTWWKRREDIRINRSSLRSLLLCGLFGLLFFFPWQTTVRAPAVLTAVQVSRIHPGGAGQVEEVLVQEGDHVSRGDVLARLSVPELAIEQRKAELRIALNSARIGRGTADAGERSLRIVLEGELAAARESLAAVEARREKLVIRAPHDGKIVNLDRNLQPGQWTNESRLFALVVDDKAARVNAWIDADRVEQIKPGAASLFVPEEFAVQRFAATLHAAKVPVDDDPMLAPLLDIAGGAIATTTDPQSGKPKPAFPHYQLAFAMPAGIPVPTQEMRGTMHIDARARSIASRVARRVIGVLIRESGF